MSVKIVIDSTADLPSGQESLFSIVPLTIRFGEQEYIDGITITHKQFYEKLIESDVLPTTSQASPAAFAQVYEEITQAGDTAVVITVSSKLSGTCQSAMIAAADYPGQIYVVDSNTIALGSGILAQFALRLVDEGLSAAEIAQRLTEERNNVRLIALLDTLEYLKRGGRISKTVAFAGGLLNIKPVICIRDGAIEILGKARGSKQGNNLLVKEIEQSGGVDFTKPLMLGYTGISDALLRKYIADSAYIWEGHVDDLPQTVVGSVVGTHAGPGAVAVAFFAK
ncbi:MAG: DegV family protein [Clostridia bacterium]|nr:DegV family protein [Clostridia bacterium]